ncbi:hypothetical protein O7632_10140 [Solwaraspora sp. WMMD406]|uniref:hypothetical protein n=1 Tax=Solwaraspora sp. WMMD406 TaxID=3016095 RepID=UPI0024176E42|nr:hypothetical protein [Solwaraspora sp. WMMD406]MDG4764460.1 hypothetical protein [Solwaraspora sp. WMMD406]
MTGRSAAGVRARVEALLANSTSPQTAIRELLGERWLWWRACGEAVTDDPGWLTDTRSAELHAWIKATVPDRAAGLTAVDQPFLLGRALSASGGTTGDHHEALSTLRDMWEHSGLLSAKAAPGHPRPSGRDSGHLTPAATSGLASLVEWLRSARADAEPTPAENMLVIAALLLSGAEPRRRPVVTMPVVFGGSTGEPDMDGPGVTGILELREFPAGPAGLYPDPRAMADVRSPNGQFALSVGHAWSVAGPRGEGRCVLWRIVLTDRAPAPLRIEGPSLGAAFALGLRELLRYPRSRRPSIAGVRAAFSGPRPRTAVTGALDGGGRLLKVSDMEAKLRAARRGGLRLVAPAANRIDLANAPEPDDVRFAATLGQARRYVRRYRTVRVATALALLLAATTSGLVVQYQNAEARQRLVTAHRLAEVAQSLLNSDVGLAELFAVHAYRQHDDSLTRRVLFEAVRTSPHLVSRVDAGGTVTAVGSSADENLVLAGTDAGEVRQWELTGLQPSAGRTLGRLPSAVTEVAADAAGRTVAAIDERSVMVWRKSQPSATPTLPVGSTPTAVGVSPDGRFVAVTAKGSAFDAPPTLLVLDRYTGDTRALELPDMPSSPDSMAFSSDTEVVLLDGDGYGAWTRVGLESMIRVGGSVVGFGVHNVGSAIAPDGSAFTYSNKGSSLPVLITVGEPDLEKPHRQAQVPEGLPAAVALSGGALAAAIAIGSTLYVSWPAEAGRTVFEPWSLPGAGKVSTQGLAFVGYSQTKLVSASGSVLTMWDLWQYSRVATARYATIPFQCNGCPGPSVSVSPDGRTAAVGTGTTIVVQDLSGDAPGRVAQAEDQRFGAMVWRPDNSGVMVGQPDGSTLLLTPDGEEDLLATDFWDPVPDPLDLPDEMALLQPLPGGRQIAELDKSGTVLIRDVATGEVLRTVPGPEDRAPTIYGSSYLNDSWRALDQRAAHAAIINYNLEDDTTTIVVTTIATGRSRILDGEGAAGLAYIDDQLLIQRDEGELEIWTADGSRRVGRLEGTPGTAVGPAVGDGLLAAKPGTDDSVRLIEYPSGDVLATLPLPQLAGSRDLSTGLAFSKDGRTLVTATEAIDGRGIIIAWQLDPTAWVRAACASAGGTLSSELWRQYLDTDPPSDLGCTS